MIISWFDICVSRFEINISKFGIKVSSQLAQNSSEVMEVVSEEASYATVAMMLRRPRLRGKKKRGRTSTQQRGDTLAPAKRQLRF